MAADRTAHRERPRGPGWRLRALGPASLEESVRGSGPARVDPLRRPQCRAPATAGRVGDHPARPGPRGLRRRRGGPREESAPLRVKRAARRGGGPVTRKLPLRLRRKHLLSPPPWNCLSLLCPPPPLKRRRRPTPKPPAPPPPPAPGPG